MDINAYAAENSDSNDILEDSVTQQASDGFAPCFEKETDITSMSDGKQDEAWNLYDLTVGTSVEHDAVALRTRNDSDVVPSQSSAARERRDISPDTHFANLAGQAEIHHGVSIRHLTYECPNRIAVYNSATSLTASGSDQATTIPIGARAGQSPAHMNDLFLEG